jgi:hypothetical protein
MTSQWYVEEGCRKRPGTRLPNVPMEKLKRLSCRRLIICFGHRSAPRSPPRNGPKTSKWRLGVGGSTSQSGTLFRYLRHEGTASSTVHRIASSDCAAILIELMERYGKIISVSAPGTLCRPRIGRNRDSIASFFTKFLPYYTTERSI